MHWFGHELGWGGMIFGGIMMLVFWGSIIALIIWAVKSAISQNDNRTTVWEPAAREILDRRYARDEIGREEYKNMKEDLHR